MGRKKGYRWKISCFNCNRLIEVPHWKKNQESFFCNRKCKGEHMSKKNVGHHNPAYKHGLSAGSKFKCNYCGKVGIRNCNKQRYCNNSCQMKDEFKTGKRRQDNENHANWKGEKAGYQAIHIWVRKNKPKPKLCEHCKKKRPCDIANISGKYKRDINDYEYLCRRCHMIQDGRLKV